MQEAPVLSPPRGKVQEVDEKVKQTNKIRSPARSPSGPVASGYSDQAVQERPLRGGGGARSLCPELPTQEHCGGDGVDRVASTRETTAPEGLAAHGLWPYWAEKRNSNCDAA